MVNAKSRPKVSIILPAYNEEDNIGLFYRHLAAQMEKMAEYDFECIFVDDGSSDKTPALLSELRKSDRRVEIIRFTRNRGSHPAISAGLKFCRGAAAIIMSVDLQDDPAMVLPKLTAKWRDGHKVVWGVREMRKGEGAVTLFFSKLFYVFTNMLTDTKQPPTGVGTILLDRTVIDAFNGSSEKNLSVVMLISWLGYPQTEITYISEARHSGRSKWTLAKKIKLTLDSLIAFSYLPLRLMILMGFVCVLMSMGYCAYILVNKFLHNILIEGWSSIMVVVLFMGGIQMLMLGMLGEYIWRIYDETRPRAHFVIEKNTIQDSGL